MEILRNTCGSEPPPANDQSCPDSFKQHLDHMKIFRRCHDFAEHNEYSKALFTFDANIEPVAAEFHKLWLTLLKIGYVLNLIHERGTVLLPRNWQN